MPKKVGYRELGHNKGLIVPQKVEGVEFGSQ